MFSFPFYALYSVITIKPILKSSTFNAFMVHFGTAIRNKNGRCLAVPLHGAGLGLSGKYEEGYWRFARILKS
jgi:hypothetical protein